MLVWQAHITLTDVRVPEASRLPHAQSFKDTGRVLAGTRNAVAWAALGHATAAYEIAIDYCTERTQFGKPLVSTGVQDEGGQDARRGCTRCRRQLLPAAGSADGGRVSRLRSRPSPR